MKKVTRRQFSRFVRTLPDDWANPVTGYQISVMQYVNPHTNKVLAQAIYNRGAAPEYRIK